MRVFHPVYMAFIGLSVLLAAEERPAISLEEAVRLAIDRHQDVEKARAAADGLKGKIREVRSQALPDIQIVSNAMRWRAQSASPMDTEGQLLDDR